MVSKSEVLLSYALPRVDFIPGSPHSPRWLLQLRPSHHHPSQQKTGMPHPVRTLHTNGKIAFICTPLARTLSHGFLLEEMPSSFWAARFTAEGPGSIMEEDKSTAGGGQASALVHQPLLLPLVGRRPFPEENLFFSCEALGFGSKV